MLTMMIENIKRAFYFGIFFLLIVITLNSCQSGKETIANEDAKPWSFWYWMHGAVTKEAITADLESMKEAGFGGAYVFSIRDVRDSSFFASPVKSMSPEWWEMIKHAMSEAERLGMKMGMSACDGFTAAGGPWITPEMSMQKIVWADTIVNGIQFFDARLPQPPVQENYYRDIAAFAYPVNEQAGLSSYKMKPLVTSSLKGEELQFLAEKGNQKQFETKEPCWIQYSFQKPFTCRSLTISTGWNNYQSNRLIIEVSNDGKSFTFHERLKAPRHGWEDLDANATHLIRPVTARYFRFVYDPEGSEPGAEDLDDAKWAPAFLIKGIELSSDEKISQFEGKSGAIWRIAGRENDTTLPESACVKMNKLIRLETDSTGILKWQVPAGRWRILRIGHTSTGHINYVGGGGKGLECDKLNPEVVRFQFDQWFGEAFRRIGPELAGKVLKRFHVDSWECGSQNWSPVFADEFVKRRGYDLLNNLPLMAGIPLENAEYSEKVLSDIRQTIADLVVENFYWVMKEEAHKKGCLFSAESIAPVMMSDGMQHFREVDLPMGEFWLRSPSHDKPNDILDAVSGAHIYGKNLVQAEGFTEIRLDWDEDPAMLKPLADRNFALGINKLFFHVFTLNPWGNRKPGMTLDKVGTFLQRDQTWWKQGKAFVSYLTNCQSMLQTGSPVVDIAVFTGEETPRRAVLPDRLTGVFPGIIGPEKLEEERIRLQNEGIPVHDMPRYVSVQKNIANPVEWVDPLRGYVYDSFNKDALIRLASVENGKIVLPGGACYSLLAIPGDMKMAPGGGKFMSLEVVTKLKELAEAGAAILIVDKPEKVPGLNYSADLQLKAAINELFSGEELMITDDSGNRMKAIRKGKGLILTGKYILNSFDPIDLTRDFFASEKGKTLAHKLAWNHRKSDTSEIYFVANQMNCWRELELSFRIDGKIPVFYHPVSGRYEECCQWESAEKRMKLKYRFGPNESVFVIFKENAQSEEYSRGTNYPEYLLIRELNEPWAVQFDNKLGGPEKAVSFLRLEDWTTHQNDSIRFFSGTAHYSTSFQLDTNFSGDEKIWLDLGKLANLAGVKLNGIDCGICWTEPFMAEITKAVRKGENNLEISLTNTWRNRLIGDHGLPENKQITWTTAPYRLEGLPLMPSGLFGPVKILKTTSPN